MGSKIVDKTPCSACIHEEICSLKEIHNENIKSMQNLDETIPFGGFDVIYIECSAFNPIALTRSRAVKEE